MLLTIPETSFKRDLKSCGLVETDKGKIEEYRSRAKMQNMLDRYKNEINTLKEKICEIDNIKSDINEIKELLKRFAR